MPEHRPWTAAEFRAFGLALHGAAHGWQSALARRLGVASRTVRRWAAGDVAVPEKVQSQCMRLAGVGDAADPAWPRDEWVLGDGPPDEQGERREYLIHTRVPRFVARVVALDEVTAGPEPFEDPVETSGVVYRILPETQLCEFAWIDAPPTDLVALMEAAGDAVEAAG